MMKNKIKYILLFGVVLAICSCQRTVINVTATKLATVMNLKYTITGDTVLLTWNLPAGGDQLNPTINGSASAKLDVNTTSYKFGIVETNKPYAFTVKLIDNKGDYSLGQTVDFTRDGAAPVKNVSGLQVDNNVLISWTAPDLPVSKITIKFGTQSVDVAPGTTSYQFNNIAIGSYIVSIVTTNSSNQTSNTVYLPFKVGATKVGYIGMYSDSATLISTGDDDEVAAAKWLFSNYPTSRYISFNQVKNNAVDLSQFRVIWWNYDLVATTALPAIAIDPTVVTAMTSYYKNGGNLLLNQYAVQYFWTLGRITNNYFMQYDGGAGFNNPDAWGVGVNIHEKHDQSGHPIFKGISMTKQGDGRITFPVIGAGWKENHNAVIVRIPEFYGGLPNDSEDAYSKFTTDNNAVWLGMWDGIGDYYMGGVFEFQPKDAYQGSGIFIGIGGIEWNQNNSVNAYQGNIQLLYKNAIDYLKTK